MDAAALGASIVEATRSFVTRSLEPLVARLDAMDARARLQATSDVEKRIRSLASRVAALEKEKRND